MAARFACFERFAHFASESGAEFSVVARGVGRCPVRGSGQPNRPFTEH